MKISEDLFDSWYETFKDDQGLLIATGLFPDEEIVPEAAARTWFSKRLREVNRLLSKASEEPGAITIHRCMSVNNSWLDLMKSRKIRSIGAHWTIDKDLVKFLKGGFGGRADQRNIIIEAKIGFHDFDHQSLFQASYADEYEEYEVLPTGPVSIIRIWNGDQSAILFEPESPIEIAID